ncbi:MAG: hypothetical protein F6K58_29000 [Symploca sp. SIO2E9]|nr:hypothetical protein [Symploca sp. SIO2E9]
MTLDKHTLDGIPQITSKTLPVVDFERLLINGGYTKIGSAPARGARLKVWWTHPTYRSIESIYSADGTIAITAYHTVT